MVTLFKGAEKSLNFGICVQIIFMISIHLKKSCIIYHNDDYIMETLSLDPWIISSTIKPFL